MKYSKGKWHYGSMGHIVNEFGRTICRMFGDEETKYNAKLIIKAPKMYEALKDLVLIQEEFGNDSSNRKILRIEKQFWNNLLSILKEIES